jgi:predicted amidohydrolase YtcJ
MDDTRSWAEAVAISQGKIVYVGDDAGSESYLTGQARVLELDGKMVLPGFHDSHVHPVESAVELGQCDLIGPESQEQVFAAIRECAAENPDREWITGAGWDLPLFPDANPSKGDLDRLVPDRPVYLGSVDGHSAWVNSRALELAGITASTPDPPKGRIEREPKTGEPSGTLREYPAMDLVPVPQPTAEDYVEAARRALAMANRFGITSLQEADATDPGLEAYAELDRRGELTVRLVAALETDPARGEEQIPELIQKRDKYSGTRLRADAVKLYADGVIEPRTAAVLEPYLDGSGRGELNWEPELLETMVLRLDEEGFQIHIHAIGDRGVRVSLDALQAHRQSSGRTDARHHIAHLQLIDPEDIPRFAELGVIANFQALWAYADTYIAELTAPALGPERSRWLYPIGSVVRTGTMIVGGSDWYVSSMNPLDAIQVALTRKGLDDPRGKPWIPEERVDLDTMLAAYTINGAYLNRQEETTGSLEPGKLADLIVLDRNLFQIPPEEIHQAKVLLTLLEGMEVYRDARFPFID